MDNICFIKLSQKLIFISFQFMTSSGNRFYLIVFVVLISNIMYGQIWI